MELDVQEGGQARNPSEALIAPGDWTIFPVGWPGPEPSFESFDGVAVLSGHFKQKEAMALAAAARLANGR